MSSDLDTLGKHSSGLKSLLQTFFSVFIVFFRDLKKLGPDAGWHETEYIFVKR